MKNIHVLPTDKPSRLLYFGTSKELTLQDNPATFRVFERSPQHIYITFDEEIKEGDWCYNSINNNVYKKEIDKLSFAYEYKIILTTDQDLIKDGVQAIDGEFLEWFVKNPSCELVPIANEWKEKYKIIIPKEEPKQDLEKEMFDLEQELDIPSHLRWHNSKPKQRLEKYSERFDNKDNELVEGIFNPDTWGKRMVDDAPKEITLEEVFNDEKREGVKKIIDQHKVLKGLSLINPLHLQMTSNGHGEFPDGYKLTEKGIQYIIEKLNKV